MPAHPNGEDACSLVLFLVAIVLLLVLPGPWNVIGFTISLVLASGEVFFWQRTVRGRKAAVGAQTMIGAEAEVLTACRPEGQVRLGGEIWDARCSLGADPGASVRVIGRKGLTLIVERKQ
jgi:membrane protein implicated in regulation of membrane protease activity